MQLNETIDEVNLCHQSLNFVHFEHYPKNYNTLFEILYQW